MVYGQCFCDRHGKAVVKAQLSNVLRLAPGVCAVREHRSVDLGDDMDVSCTSKIVTGEGGAELNHPILVADLDATMERRVQASGAHDAGIDARRVGVPEVDYHVRNRLARLASTNWMSR